MKYRLILQTSQAAGTEYRLEKDEIFLGRDLSNDLVINDPEVSRRHARLFFTGSTYAIEDLGSTNGTFVHGQRLSGPFLLSPGDWITLGEKVILKFDLVEFDPDATVATFRAQPISTPQPVHPVVPAAPSESPVQINVPPVQPFISSSEAPESLPQQPSFQPAQPPRPAAPEAVPQQPSFQPAQPPRPAAPAVPPQPVFQPPVTVEAPEEGNLHPQQKKRSGWVVALLVVIGILLVFCVIPWIIIEVTNSYCALFPGLFNSIQPGVCP